MAIYHLSGTIISRSQGRSAVACAAYRSAEKLHDERYSKTHDYTHKKEVVHTEILLPKNAPPELSNREKLWNRVEATEKRKDAQLAREFNISLPRELPLSQNIKLAREFVQTQFVDKGMIADLCIHNDKQKDGEFQPHAHVMLTLRQVTPDGFKQKVREWNSKENLLHWREAWAELTNKYLYLDGHDIKIDHRTLKAQEIELEPQHKIGAVVASARLARLSDHQRIARENGEKILENPNIALDAITRQQSTFTHQDLARFINRHTENAEQFQLVYEKIKSSQEMVYLGKDAHHRERYTTKSLLEIERSMLEKAKHLNQNSSHPVTEKSSHTKITSSLTPEQKMAFDHLINPGALKNIIGYAGTGKSYLLGAAREAWESQGYQVKGAALSGIAAENLEAGSGILSRTLASREYYWNKREEKLTSRDILVIDEAGMIGSRQLNRILTKVQRAKAKVVLVGDAYQLQAIEAGAAFRAISEISHTVSLTEIRRQKFDWQREATVELATGKTESAIERYSQKDHVHAFETKAKAQQGLIELWNDVRINESQKTQIMLAYTREEVKSLNERARQIRKDNHELGKEHVLETARGTRAFAEKDRIYFLQNDRELGVKNGSLGTITRIQENLLTIQLDKKPNQKTPRTITFSTERYNHLEHGYAATIHKSQGVTVDKSYVLASKYLDAHSTYVSLSRHRESVDIFYSKEEFQNERALSQTLSRERSKDVSSDYLESPENPLKDNFTKERGKEDSFHTETNRTLEPESLSAFKARYEAKYDLSLKADDPLAVFKARYEMKNPDLAKMHQEMLSPSEEKSFERQANRFNELSQQVEKGEIIQKEKDEYALSLQKEPRVMAHLQYRHPELYREVREIARVHEKQKALEKERTLDHEQSL